MLRVTPHGQRKPPYTHHHASKLFAVPYRVENGSSVARSEWPARPGPDEAGSWPDGPQGVALPGNDLADDRD